MRPQSSGYNAIGYEDFKPKLEWKKEEGANILLLQLPGFSKEQITYEQSNRIIRVFGERPIGNNIKRRFNRTFGLPENCKTDKIYSNLENENFKIIMPKKIVTQVGPSQATNTTQETPFPPKVASENYEKEKNVPSQIPQKDTVEPMAQKDQKDHNETPPQVGLPQAENTIQETLFPPKVAGENDEKEKSRPSQIPQNDTAKPMAQKDQKDHDETPPQVGPSQAANTTQETLFPPKAARENNEKEKSVTSQIPQKETAELTTQKGQKDHDETSPQVGPSQATNTIQETQFPPKAAHENDEKEKSEPSQISQKDTAEPMTQNGQKDHDETPLQVCPSQATNTTQEIPFPPKVACKNDEKEKSVPSQIPQKGTAEPTTQKGQKDHDETPPQVDPSQAINTTQKTSFPLQAACENDEKEKSVPSQIPRKDTAELTAQKDQKDHHETPPQINLSQATTTTQETLFPSKVGRENDEKEKSMPSQIPQNDTTELMAQKGQKDHDQTPLQVCPSQAANTTQEISFLPNAALEIDEKEKSVPSQISQKDTAEPTTQKGQKDHYESLPQVCPSQTLNATQDIPFPPKVARENDEIEKSVASQIPQKDTAEPTTQKDQKDHYETPPQVDSTIRTIKKADNENDKKNETTKVNGKPNESKETENVGKKTQVIEKKEENSDKIASDVEEKGKEDAKDTNKDIEGLLKILVCVIMAIGAYISYNKGHLEY